MTEDAGRTGARAEAIARLEAEHARLVGSARDLRELLDAMREPAQGARVEALERALAGARQEIDARDAMIAEHEAALNELRIELADLSLVERPDDDAAALLEAQALVEELEAAVRAQRQVIEQRELLIARQSEEIGRLERAVGARGDHH